ncbi:MAG TPA: hypothetical protein VN253_30190, partial [Kofleriaceae bacterium]|nr:hypothetical protein [Kofleriaceae bacterium]
MTAAVDPAIRDHAAKTDALEADARALAETQRELARAPRTGRRGPTPSPVTLALEQARRRLAQVHAGDAAPPKAAEWFLDNYYLIRRVARQVDEELPQGFVRHLPQLAAGPARGRPRIAVLAEALVGASDIELDVAAVRRFVDAYQDVSPLAIAELWALPVMLRASVLSHLLGFLEQPELSAVGVERCTRALRLLDAIDWKAFFEATSRVEAILRGDPARVYARMDFETCDAYRKVVEELAWATGRGEPQVAELAVALARQEPPDERAGHVGYYLIDGGRCALEQRLGYRARGIERVRRAAMRRPTPAYLVPLAGLTAILLLALGEYLGRRGAEPLAIAVALAVAAVPVSGVAVALVQRGFALLLPPRRL